MGHGTKQLDIAPEGGDLELARRARNGDEEAFRELVEAMMPVLYRFASARLGSDRELVREVVQSTLCRVIENLKRYRGEASLVTWACGICRFEIFAVYKQNRRRPKPVELMEEQPEIRGALETLSTGPRDPEESLRRKQLVRLVHLTLDHLPPRYGQALEWKYTEGLSVQEIADRLGVSAKAAESILSRARQAFREAFATIDRVAADDPVPA